MIMSGTNAYPFNNTNGAGRVNLPINGNFWRGSTTIANAQTVDIPIGVPATNNQLNAAIWWPEAPATPQRHRPVARGPRRNRTRVESVGLRRVRARQHQRPGRGRDVEAAHSRLQRSQRPAAGLLRRSAHHAVAAVRAGLRAQPAASGQPLHSSRLARSRRTRGPLSRKAALVRGYGPGGREFDSPGRQCGSKLETLTGARRLFRRLPVPGERLANVETAEGGQAAPVAAGAPCGRRPARGRVRRAGSALHVPRSADRRVERDRGERHARRCRVHP